MDKCKTLSLIRSKTNKNEIRVGARKCELREIKQKEANVFLEKYHLQGKTQNQSVCLGLFYGNDLVEVMTFGKPRFNKNFEWELTRLCSKNNVTVQGGVSKLWAYFKEKFDPQNCLCYLNLNLGGDNFSLKDFKFSKYVDSAGYWEHLKSGRTISNNSLRMRGASRFVGDENFERYPKGMRNEDIMIKEGYVEIFDCGTAVYEYKKK